MKILLTDIKYRKSFDVYNCLKYRDYKVILADENPVLTDRLVYGKKIFTLRKNSISDFSDDIRRIKDSFKDEELVYLPVEEDTSCLFLEYIENNGRDGLAFALPDRATFELSRDKKQLSRFCSANNIPCPKEFTFSELQDRFVRVIAKPCIGSGSEGLVFVNTPEELGIISEYGEDYLIQEQLPDPRSVEGAFFLFDNGQLVSYYGHQRLRTYPVKAGVTVYSKISFNDDLKAVGATLLQKLNWHGLAMVEFLFDPVCKEYKVIEINPRLWGSVLLSEFANTGFLSNYIQISLGQVPEHYLHREDVAIRWFFPFDLLNYVSMKGRIKNFWSFNKHNTCYVGFTYSSIVRSVLYILFSIFSFNKIRKFFKKVTA